MYHHNNWIVVSAAKEFVAQKFSKQLAALAIDYNNLQVQEPVAEGIVIWMYIIGCC